MQGTSAMSSTEPRRVHSRLIGQIPVAQDVPNPAAKKPGIGIVIAYLFLAAMFIGALWMIASEPKSREALFTGLLMAAVGAMLLGLAVGSRAITGGRVHVADSGPLTFLPGYGYLSSMGFGAVGLVVAGSIGVLSNLLPSLTPIRGIAGRGSLGLSTFALVAGSILLVRYVLPNLKAKIVVDHNGVEWVSGFRATTATWSEIETVDLVGSNLELTTSSEVRKVSPYTFATAPGVIIQTLRYYQRNPNCRHVLQEPWAALNTASMRR